jgi:hypothetical protein
MISNFQYAISKRRSILFVLTLRRSPSNSTSKSYGKQYQHCRTGTKIKPLQFSFIPPAPNTRCNYSMLQYRPVSAGMSIATPLLQAMPQNPLP